MAMDNSEADDLDEALLRAGRFDKKLRVSLPDARARRLLCPFGVRVRPARAAIAGARRWATLADVLFR